MMKISNCKYSAMGETLHYPLCRAGNTVAEIRGCGGMLALGHDTAMALGNSQQLCLPAQTCINILSWRGSRVPPPRTSTLTGS